MKKQKTPRKNLECCYRRIALKQLLPREFLSTILHSAFIMTVVMSLGCQRSGPERFRVQGMVNFGGQPVELGTIKFRPIEGTKAPLTGGRISEGHYDVPAVKGPLAGKYMVQIDVHEKTGRKITNMGVRPGARAYGAGPVPHFRLFVISMGWHRLLPPPALRRP